MTTLSCDERFIRRFQMGGLGWRHPNPFINLSITKSEYSNIVSHLVWLNGKFIAPSVNYYTQPPASSKLNLNLVKLLEMTIDLLKIEEIEECVKWQHHKESISQISECVKCYRTNDTIYWTATNKCHKVKGGTVNKVKET